MDDADAHQWLREIVKQGPMPGDEPETYPLMEASLRAFAELQRYREREPLVQELLCAVAEADVAISTCREFNRIADAAGSVRDFAITPSKPEADGS